MQTLLGIFLVRDIISIKQLFFGTSLPSWAGSETLAGALFYGLLLPTLTPVWVILVLKFCWHYLHKYLNVLDGYIEPINSINIRISLGYPDSVRWQHF